MNLEKKSNVWDFFGKKLVINLKKRVDRLEKARIEFEKVGIEAVGIFQAIEGGWIGFQKSQLECLKIASTVDGPTIIFEDDVLFLDNTVEILEKATSELPKDWKILYLGGMVFQGEFKGVKYSDHLVTCDGLVCTHAVAYNTGVAAEIYKRFSPYPIWSKKQNMYDCFLANEIFKEGNCFMVNPMIAYQQAGYSDLSNEASVGVGMFELTQRKINEKIRSLV